MKNLNLEQFERLMEEGTSVLVEFWAPWCVYCRRIAPALEKTAQQYGQSIVIAQVNIDEAPDLARQENIQVIPAFVLYKNGQAAASIVAPESKAKIEEFLRSNGVI